MKTLAVFILALGFAAQSTASNADCKGMSASRLEESTNPRVQAKSSGSSSSQATPSVKGKSRR